MDKRASERSYSRGEPESKCTPVMIVNLVLEHHLRPTVFPLLHTSYYLLHVLQSNNSIANAYSRLCALLQSRWNTQPNVKLIRTDVGPSW